MWKKTELKNLSRLSNSPIALVRKDKVLIEGNLISINGLEFQIVNTITGDLQNLPKGKFDVYRWVDQVPPFDFKDVQK